MNNEYAPEILEEIRKSLQQMCKDKVTERDGVSTKTLEAEGQRY